MEGECRACSRDVYVEMYSAVDKLEISFMVGKGMFASSTNNREAKE